MRRGIRGRGPTHRHAESLAPHRPRGTPYTQEADGGIEEMHIPGQRAVAPGRFPGEGLNQAGANATPTGMLDDCHDELWQRSAVWVAE